MKIKNVLISQPAPPDITKSPYATLVEKHKLNLTFFKFFDIEGVTATEFRKTRIHLSEYSAVIFTSKNAIDHFFHLAKELRETIPETTNYFCPTELTARYLQTYISYRKRKVHFATKDFAELIDIMAKHRDLNFLLPSSDEKQTEYTKLLDKAKFKYTKATMYHTIPRDLKQFDLDKFQLLALFSPIGVRALIESFPDIANRDVAIAAFGTATHAALNAAGINITIAAPTKAAPSMSLAIESYLNGKDIGTVTVNKPQAIKTTRTTTRTPKATAPKRTKSVIADKEKYKQMQENRKAQAAAKRAQRAAAKANADASAQNTESIAAKTDTPNNPTD